MLDKSQWGYEEGNPSNVSEEEQQPTELEEALQDAWKQKTAKWRAERKIENATDKLNLLLDFANATDNSYLQNKINEIINELK